MELLLKYFPELSEDQKSKLSLLPALYEDWNSKINVISRKDIEHLIERHILHSLSIARFIQFQKGTRVLDVGTGGGFPGIPLAIFFPDVHFHLVDSIGKKIKVVKEIADEIGLQNLSTEHIRAEEVIGTYEFVVSRAVAEMKTISGWVSDKIVPTIDWKYPHGMIFLKGGDLDEEIKQMNRPVQVVEISNWFEEEFFSTKKIVFMEI